MELPETIVKKYPDIKNILDNPHISSDQKNSELLPIISGLRQDRAQLKEKIHAYKQEVSNLDDIKSWIELLEVEYPSLERNDCSRLHKLAEAVQLGKVSFIKKESEMEITKKFSDDVFTSCHAFVVEHDWAQAFKGASDYDGEVQIPFPMCAFEFRIVGRSIIVIAVQNDNQGRDEIADTPFLMIAFVKMKSLWVCLEEGIANNDTFIMIYEQIKAICVALEAQIAVDNIVRASVELNKKREEKEKLPLFDYHVVSLNKKYNSGFDGGGTHRSPRFHFRRGHWRHFQNHKTYVKWTLVGNPELGFIDKHYKL